MQKVSEQITNLRKAQNKRENDRKELADVVEQEKLIEIKGAVCCWPSSLTANAIQFQGDDRTS